MRFKEHFSELFRDSDMQIGKHFSELFRNDELRPRIRLRRRFIDYDEVPAPKITQQSRGGIYHQRSASHDQRIRRSDCVYRTRHHAVISP